MRNPIDFAPNWKKKMLTTVQLYNVFCRFLDTFSEDGYQLTAHLVVLGVILIVFGLVFTFVGYRSFAITMFISGFFFFGDIAWILLENIDPSSGYGPYKDTIFLVVSVGTGLVGGLVVVCCYHLGIYLLAAMGGYSLGLWLLSWADQGVVQETWGRVVLLMGLAIIAIVLVIFFERPIIIVLTAIIGSLSFFIGLDVFIHTGFIYTIQQFIDRNQSAVTLTYRIYAMLAGVAALAIFGAVVQFFVHPKQDKWARTHAWKKKEEEEAEEEVKQEHH